MLTVITGPMFSGKSSKLISMAMAHVIAGHHVVAYKPVKDLRYPDDETNISTHAGHLFPARPINSQLADEIPLYISNYQRKTETNIDVVIIDEAQFMDPDGLIQSVDWMLYEVGKTIIVSGLSQDSNGKPFGAMPHLLAIADDIIHLKSVCAKSKKIGAATRTYRKDKMNTNQVAVGGSELYEPRSFETWLMERKQT